MRLVITADDLGLTAAVTSGVLEAHRRGVVRSASLLVTFPASAEAAALARAEPGLEIGLHLDLVGGTPASEPARVRSLVDGEGRFHPLGELMRRLVTGRIRARELAAETRAQAARARAWGVPALAWDSHRHVHAMPLVARVVGAVAREEGVRWLRRPAPPPAWRSWKARLLGLAAGASAPFFRGLPGNTWYVDASSWDGDAASLALLATYGGVGEIGAHPGHVDDELRAADTLLERRRGDLALLTDPLLRAAFGEEAVSWRVR